MARYADGTSVAPTKTIEEVKRTLQRFGASGFRMTEDWQNRVARVEFVHAGVGYSIPLSMPSIEEFRRTPTGNRRDDEMCARKADEETRRRWRSLAAGIKLKLDWVETGIVAFEYEFLPWVLTATGETVGDRITPMIRDAALAGTLPDFTASDILALPEHSEEREP